TEYRRAYEGKLSKVLRGLVDGGHLIWIGFSFADQRITAILRQIANGSGPRIDPGPVPRHIAIMPWDPGAEGNDPQIFARRAEIGFGAKLGLSPARGGNRSAREHWRAEWTDGRFRPVAKLPARSARPEQAGIPVQWTPPPEPVEYFTGRAEELARLDRWAADPEIRLIGVTAWGGGGEAGPGS